MKKILLTLCALMLTAAVHAADTPTMCQSMSTIATGIMRLRQMGAPPDIALKTCGSTGLPIANVCRSYVLDAYDEPVFSVKENQDREVTDFASTKYVHCLRQRGDAL